MPVSYLSIMSKFYDGVLKLDLPARVRTVVFVDDLVVLAMGPTSESVEALMFAALSKIRDWMATNDLCLSLTKTGAVMLSRRRDQNDPELTLEGYQVSLRANVKYLGAILDTTSSFRKHIEEVFQKVTNALGRLIPNVKGLSRAKRGMLGSHEPYAVCGAGVGLPDFPVQI